MDFPSAVAWLEDLTGHPSAEPKKGEYQDKGSARSARPGASWKAPLLAKVTGSAPDPGNI